MFNALLFDFDGVVLDSISLMRFAFAESYRRVVGESEPPVNDFLAHSGDALQSILGKMKLPPEMRKHYRQISIKNMSMIEIVPGMCEVLEILVKRGFKLGLVTGKESDRTAGILEFFNLASYFSVVICSDMVEQAKPHPACVYKALAELRTDPAQTILVGDTKNDIIAAKRANVTALGVSWGIGKRNDLIRAGADRVVDYPYKIIDFLDSLNRQVCFASSGSNRIVDNEKNQVEAS